MKRLFFIISAGLLVITAFQACKKDSKLLSASDWVVGSWKLTLQGNDKNNDGQFSVDEKNTIHDSAVITYQFKSGGAGYRIGPNMSYVDTLRWSLLDNNRVLRLRLDDHGLINEQFFRFELNYTDETLLITDTSVSPIFFRQYQREN
jgi:hypothetical protein